MAFNRMKKQTYKNGLMRLLCIIPLMYASYSLAAERVLYRYVNDEGVKVLRHSIPPKYAQNGYEILSQSGMVIKVIPPAPTEEEAAAKEEQRIMLERYTALRRRFSDVEEIKAAKERKLETIETSSSIIRGNVNSLETQLENLMGKAATAERSGRSVPPYLLEQISAARTELSMARELLTTREEEKKELQEKYFEDLSIFAKGQAWEAQNAAKK